MLATVSDTIRLSLHILAATIWVGGQIVLAFLVPVLRAAGGEVPRSAARAYNKVAWPAFWVLVVTGIWNVVVERDTATPAWNAVLGVKVAFVALSGVAAFLHTRATDARGRAVWGSLSGASALILVVLGVVLAG